MLMRRAEGDGTNAKTETLEPRLARSLRRQQGSGRPLPEPARSKMEHHFGQSFRRVRVHTGSEANSLSHELNANAFTVGQDVFFRKNAYEPATRPGQRLIAHELAHVVQRPSDHGTSPHAMRIIPATDSSEVAADRTARALGPSRDAGTWRPLGSASHGIALQRQPDHDDEHEGGKEDGEPDRDEPGSQADTPTPVERTREYDDCASFVADLNDEESERRRGKANAEVSHPYTFQTSAQGDAYEASAVLRWEYDLDKSSSWVERPAWPDMTEAEARAVDEWVDRMKAHEDGHHHVAQELVADQQPEEITGRGATSDEAERDMKEKIEAATTAFCSRLGERQQAYDDKTDHGRNQKAVGGENTTFTCPA